MIIYDYKQFLRNQPVARVSHIPSGMVDLQRFIHTAKPVITAAGGLLGLAFFDAVVGGGIAVALRADGWDPLDQKANQMYQLGFALLCIQHLVWRLRANKLSVVLNIVLLLGYWEDVFYYLFLPLASFVIHAIIGFGYDRIIFPAEISGWLGWVMAVIFKQEFSISTFQLIAINIASLSIAAIIISEFLERK
jgi:hypothetical protein